MKNQVTLTECGLSPADDQRFIEAGIAYKVGEIQFVSMGTFEIVGEWHDQGQQWDLLKRLTKEEMFLITQKDRPDCCVAQWDEHVACGKECSPKCHFYQNPKGIHIEPCPDCHRELLLIRDTDKYDWGGWRVICNDTLVGDGGCGYETDVYKTEIEAIEAHNQGHRKGST